MRKKLATALTILSIIILLLGVAQASPGTITGTEDPETVGVWLFSAGTNTEPGGEPTDEIVDRAITEGILKYIGDEPSEVIDFSAGPPEPYEGARDTTIDRVVEGLEAIDDFGLIEEPDDPSSNFDAGIGGWVTLGDFGEIHPDGVTANGIIGPEDAPDPDEALGGFEIFIFEDAELSGFTCTLNTKGGATIIFDITDRQVDPTTPNGADDTLIAIDLDSIPGFSADDCVTSITITDDGISMTGELHGDTTVELDAVATRVGVVILPGSITGYKWNDQNGNRIWDPGEPPLEDWTIRLSGDASKITATGAGGYYEFTDLEPGSYTVSETLETGWIQTYPPGGTHSIVLESGDASTDNNFGNKQRTPSVGGEGELTAATATTHLTTILTILAIAAASAAVSYKTIIRKRS